jgi:cytoskeletal protein CcmA (bactofilin family)
MAEQTCIIGKQITIRGGLTGAEDLIVEGNVEGTVTLSNHLTVESTGVVEADLDVEELTVNGAVRGDIPASKGIALNSGARVEGSIRAPRIAIQDGAHFSGTIEMDVDLPEELTR